MDDLQKQHHEEQPAKTPGTQAPSWSDGRGPDHVAFSWYVPRRIDMAAVAAAERRSRWRTGLVFAALVAAGMGITPWVLSTMGLDVKPRSPAASVLATPFPSVERLQHRVELAFTHKKTPLPPSTTNVAPRPDRALAATSAPPASHETAEPSLARTQPQATALRIADASPASVPVAIQLAKPAAQPKKALLEKAQPTSHPATIAKLPKAAAPVTHLFADAFDYVGRWEAVRGANDGRAQGMSERSFARNATASLHFRGSQITLYGVAGVHGGDATVSVDGSKPHHISFRAATKRVHTVVFRQNRMDERTHILVVSIAPSAARGYVNIEEADSTP